MCQPCGCQAIIEQGPEAALRRAIEVIAELGVTPANVQQFEDGERISGMLASKLGDEDREVLAIAEFVYGLHHEMYAERHRACAKAAREIFAGFPAKGSQKEVMTRWHHLEQITRDLGEETIASVQDPEVRQAIRAVQRVHDEPLTRRAELIARYGLEGF